MGLIANNNQDAAGYLEHDRSLLKAKGQISTLFIVLTVSRISANAGQPIVSFKIPVYAVGYKSGTYTYLPQNIPYNLKITSNGMLYGTVSKPQTGSFSVTVTYNNAQTTIDIPFKIT